MRDEEAVRAIRGARSRRIRAGLLLPLMLLSGLFLTGCRTKSFMSTQQEINLGQEAARQIESEYKVETDSARAQRVRRIGQSLLPHMADRRDVPYSFKVIVSPEANAVSLPGGPLYVYTGLLNMIGSDDAALAGVIGHELGHINARHAARQMSSQMSTQLLLDLALPGGVSRELAGLGAQVISLKYSRDDEFDADRRGLSYAAAAGYDPRGLIRFFEDLEKQSRGGPPEWLRTHPVNSARIQRAQTIIANKNYRYGK